MNDPCPGNPREWSTGPACWALTRIDRGRVASARAVGDPTHWYKFHVVANPSMPPNCQARRLMGGQEKRRGYRDRGLEAKSCQRFHSSLRADSNSRGQSTYWEIAPIGPRIRLVVHARRQLALESIGLSGRQKEAMNAAPQLLGRARYSGAAA
jgi:hypothetical protein